jgi:Protein of unknown function (DUF2934)
MSKSKAGAPKAVKSPRKIAAAPTYDDIAMRAYHIYLERGCTPGDPMQDWLRAEQELLESTAKPSRKSKIVSIAA